MAFDVTSASDLATLHDEVFNNVAHYGDPNNTNDILDKLNIVTEARTAGTGVPRLLLSDFFSILANESATGTQFEFNAANLFAMASQEGLGTDISQFRTDITTGAGMDDVQVTNAINAMSRDLNQMEQMFSVLDANGTTEYIVCSRNDWYAARDYTP